MSRHIVTVCMFCLLCAAHTCGSHVDQPKNQVQGIQVQDIDHINDTHSHIKTQTRPRRSTVEIQTQDHHINGTHDRLRSRSTRSIQNQDHHINETHAHIIAQRSTRSTGSIQNQDHHINETHSHMTAAQSRSTRSVQGAIQAQDRTHYHIVPKTKRSTSNIQTQDIDHITSKTSRYIQKLQKIRTTREVSVDRETEIADVDPNKFVEKIFMLYGDPDSKTMNMTGFNDMLRVLALQKLVEGGKAEKTKYYMMGVANENSAKEDDVYCLNSEQLVTTANSRLKHSRPHRDDHESHQKDGLISKETLQFICPILLYQKIANSSAEQFGCLKVSDTDTSIGASELRSQLEELSKGKHKAKEKDMFLVWLYSSLSITVISACGLLGVAVIPIMHKTYYNHLIQFLVALAVGTLCGDALLHLLPHALSPIHEHKHNEAAIDHRTAHDDGMWKGLAAMLGVVFFYFTEKGLTVVVEWRKRRQKLEEDKLPSRVRVLKDDPAGGSGGPKTGVAHSASNSLLKIFKKDEKPDPTTKTCKHKYSEYPYCYDEIDTDTHDDHHLRDGVPPSPKGNNHTNSLSVVSSIAMNSEAKEEPSAKDWLLKAENPTGVEMNNIKHKEEQTKDLKDGDSYTVILREHSRAHHGHSHAHGHVHAPPSSIASVAWMVIMGDGLHNFTDGMAIGAAFASNIAGGFSTAIAVLCHELPHELGDFAVLLKAGMSVRRAVCYNVLSSALCLAGMVCGVLAGHAPSATRWLFAVAAGTFLYIALVDMMPELSTSHSKEGTVSQCILQLMGLATGIGIMLVIAMYEHDLKNLFG